MDNAFESFTISVLRLNKLIQKIKLLEMEEFGLRAIHVMCVYYLDENRAGLTAGELVRMTLEDKAAISRALGALRDGGYIVYNTRSYNSRARLTESGLELARFIRKRAENADDAVSSGMTDDERKNLRGMLGEITKRLYMYYEALASGHGRGADAN